MSKFVTSLSIQAGHGGTSIRDGVRGERGFTLIEVVIAVALISIGVA